MDKNERTIASLKSYFDVQKQIEAGIHEQYMDLLRQYLVVEGMSEVINVFFKNNNYQDE